MIGLAQETRVDREFCIGDKFYAFDSSAIDLCMSIYDWARFRSTKSGIKLHTQLDIVTQIPTMLYITEAAVHDVNALDVIDYEPLVGYILDRGYWDLSRLYHIEQVNSFFVIRKKNHPEYVVVSGEDMLDDDSNIIRDQTVRFVGNATRQITPAQSDA